MNRKFVFFLLFTILLLSANCYASNYVKGYTRKNGTYVQGHFKSSSDFTKLNNYSTRGNLNPYTGKRGNVNPYNYKPKKSKYSY